MQIPDRQFTLFVLVVAALAVSAAWVLAFVKASIGWFSSPESHELALQFLLITAIGGGAALWLRTVLERRERDREQHQRAIENERAAAARELELQRERAERATERERAALEQKRQLLNAYYADLVQTYNEAKRIRRTLRAKSRPDGTDRRVMDRIDYENQMVALEDIQLRLEQAVREIDIQPDLFGPDGAPIKAKLEKAEEYLREVVRDYELGEHISPVQPGLVPLPKHVYEFMAQRDERRVNQLPNQRKKQFQKPIRDVRKKIVSIINATLTITGNDRAGV